MEDRWTLESPNLVKCRGNGQAGPRREEVIQIPENRTYDLCGSFKEDRKVETWSRKELECEMYLKNSSRVSQSVPYNSPGLIPEREGP